MGNKALISHLFNEEVYVLDNASSSVPVEQKQEEPQSEPNTEEPQLESNPKATFDESKIYVFSDYEISKPEKQFLAKILKAVKVDLYSIKVAEWNNDAKEFTGNNFVFNTQITECALSAKRISAPPLHKIEQSIELKKALWENMQKVYL